AYYFLSPYLENGDLFHAIQEDMKPNDGNSVVLDVETRLRILFHVASAIDFLHTPVKGFREIILHMDIKTQNIVLDKYYNARLIDFGLAREMREGEQHIYTTTKELAHTEGYYRTMKGQKLTRHADYFNFGVVIRELLTGIPFYVEGKKEHQQLKKMNELIISMAMMEMWTPKKKPTKEAEQLNKLSSTCIRDEDGVSSNYVLSVIESIVRSSNVDKWTPCEITQDKTKDSTKDTTKDKHRCEMCLVYPEVEDKVLDHAASCKSNIKVCVACMRNAYLNPIKCHSCDEQIRTII
ncbi:uncharacterized protein LOC128552721, partial [Mercenaria mercenaria]|uniref:uncharacterized protein LOC128552721 n=1 Tax=Mercenaria mercenaria TaxID=6596 RepID=UPI00234F314D